MKTKRPKTEDREPATLQGGGIVAAKVRCGLMEDPGGPDEILTAENTRDVIREHYEDAAAQILQRWQSRGRDHREKLTKWKGGPCPVDLLNNSILTVWEYPGALGEIGLHYPPLRKRATVEDAAARVKSATDETDFAGQVEAETNRRLPVIEAHEVIERGLRSAGVILSRAAADVADVSPAAIEAGLTALRRAYEPNPTGYGTASGVEYPSVNSPLWPDCMTGRDWQKLGEPLRGDLVRLRDSLVALNHTTGKAAGKTAPDKVTAPAPSNAFTRDGEIWNIRYEGRDLPTVRHRKGMTYIAALLKSKGMPISAQDLSDMENGLPAEGVSRNGDSSAALAEEVGTGGGKQAVYDARAIADMRTELEAITARLGDGDLSDLQRDKLEDDREGIEKTLKHARIEKGGLSFEGKESKQPRQAVAGCIDTAIKAIEETTGNAELSLHLRNAIDKGNDCRYTGGLKWA
jgi:hypothetical protein